ncbi:hypothetical protein BOTNAR_0106g00120 [Botryotinia narcissicola]|uniref:FAD/NAD(P)-binding domain-containing protein n=1 Tax=Botryotinia narcissicola TaxID=278944 RepID=A0A4Z1INM7_9HELO|nr:hypothetical protein BOTNAR_0106g00120 [Botryotinia narcissicola]
MLKFIIPRRQIHVTHLPVRYVTVSLQNHTRGFHNKQQFLGNSRRCLSTHTISESRPSQTDTQPKTYHNETSSNIAKEYPLGTMRPVKVISIGAGVSGINMARALKRHGTNIEHIVYDKNPEVGGTWFENCYPGCASDDPSHNYQFSHTPNPGWSSLFAPGSEIQGYLQDVCSKYDLKDRIRLSHKIIHAQWDEGSAEWVLKIENEVTGVVFEDRCHFLLNSSGMFNNWKWPDIKGLHSFQGDLVHSAKWQKDVDLKGKRVAVIGNGASGVQIVPVLQPEVTKLFHFVRTKTWISPNSKSVSHIMEQYELDAAHKFSEKQIQKFREDPVKYTKFLKTIESLSNKRFKTILRGSPEAIEAKRVISLYMAEALNYDKHLIESLLPDFPVGCRRVTPGVGYLKALTQPNVGVITSSIEEIQQNGIKLTNGEVIEVDAIVCATGFNCSFVPRFPTIGENGNLQDLWRDNPSQAYMSCMVPGIPNYITFLGPNGPLAHGAIPIITEQLSAFALKFIQKCQLQSISSFRPQPAAVKDYAEHIAQFMPRTVWTDKGVRSWYRNGKSEGPVLALHPGSQAHFFHMLESPRWEDFEWRRKNDGRDNRFNYLGNGFSVKETEMGGDDAWYWGEADKM